MMDNFDAVTFNFYFTDLKTAIKLLKHNSVSVRKI